ncbi:MAG: ABC transporter ATP-binding protein [Nitriliruptoraceae bacterium]
MDPSGNAALECHGLVKRFGATVAVDRVDLVVPRGTITALLGPSGCGKTTILRMIAGLTMPDEGTVAIDGHLVSGPGVGIPAEQRNVGLVFQDYALFPHLTVAGNVAFGLRGRGRRQRRARVRDVLDLVGMAGHADRLPSELSGGQQQRVALARALAPSPRVVLLDEPFSSLDASLRTTVREDVRAILRQADATAVFVTHDQEEALSLADRVAVMRQGRLHQVADPHTLYTRPNTRFVAEFVGEANTLVGTRAGDYLVDTSIGRLSTRVPVTDHHVDVVVRPEAVRLKASDTGPATIVGLSYFGHDQLVDLELADGQRIRARRGPRIDLERDQCVEVTVDGPVLTFPHGDAPPIRQVDDGARVLSPTG